MSISEKLLQIKKDLSKNLLTPDRLIKEVFGVGIGRKKKVVGEGINKKIENTYSIRIYATSHNPRIFAQLGIQPIPMSFPYTAPSGVVFEEIITVVPTFASVPARDFPIRDGTCLYNTSLGSPNLPKLVAGISVWRSKDDNVGTIGYFCKSNLTNEICLLSCSHVIADLGKYGDIFREAKTSIGVSSKTIGTITNPVVKVLSLDPNIPNKYFPNYIDAAIAKISAGIGFEAKIRSKTKDFVINGCIKNDSSERTDATLTDNVSKHGYGSCWTGGYIDDVNCDFIFTDEGTDLKYLFVDQFRVIRGANHFNAMTFATKGDSGALLFDNDTTKAVGLVFGIGKDVAFITGYPEPNTEYTVVTPISEIKKRLNIKLVGEF